MRIKPYFRWAILNETTRRLVTIIDAETGPRWLYPKKSVANADARELRQEDQLRVRVVKVKIQVQERGRKAKR